MIRRFLRWLMRPWCWLTQPWRSCRDGGTLHQYSAFRFAGSYRCRWCGHQVNADE